MKYIMKKLISFVCTGMLMSTLFAQNKLPQLGKDNISKVIAAMTLEEKARLVVGIGGDTWKNPASGEKTVLVPGAAGCTYQIPRLGITPAVLPDGPAGLRINSNREGDAKKYYCTAFPTATALASTWNTSLVEEVGKAMGNEVHEYGADVLLSPAINLQRNPLCGRNFEYYSEDPLLIGKLAAAMINGIQSNGVGTSLKHFVANNIETNRKSVNEVISQRALRELYLRGFEIAVKESQPWTIMSSYNRLNGLYTSQNYDLITTVLRKEWGFKGMVMTDWDGGDDAVAQMKAGNDLIMPGNHQVKELLAAVKNKTIDEKTLDENVARILDFITSTPHFKQYVFSNAPDLKAHAQVAAKAAGEAMILLKNDNKTLPFAKIKKVALFGKNSYSAFITGGTGSGEVNFEKSISIAEAFQNAGYVVTPGLQKTYQQFIDTVITNSKRRNKKFAVDFHAEMPITEDLIKADVKNNDIAIITIARNAGEGSDRKITDFGLSETEKDLIKQVSKIYHEAGKKVVVALNIGGVIATADWRDDVDAIVLAWQTGMEGANALVKILKGEVNPSGKLAQSFPMVYTDVPSADNFPGEPAGNIVNAYYNEGIYVGYRYYETFHKPTAYEFGYGLSYTPFQYSGIKLSSPIFSDKITITVTVKNTGKVAGKETVQLYIAAPKTEIEKPVQELKGFAKSKLLQPSESEQLTFTLDAKLLASYWSGMSAWVADKGQYEVLIGASSKDIRQKASFEVRETIVVEKTNPVLYQNRLLKELSISDK
ncbi:MAG: beta-glucosidase-like glycosyl hydrolase [Ferruginibacter sp.]|nr:beta-glucosidase-like glycosyl hydrolase [Ferruginibacter sp.]